MSKKHTGRAVRGSQFHLQNLIEFDQERLNNEILNNCPSLKAWISTSPVWVSPLAEENYEEYQDRSFLRKVNCLEVYPQLKEFRPRRGPVWDGLATLSGANRAKGVLLLEAKSHLNEVMNLNYACKASPKSREKIGLSLEKVKKELGVN